MKSGFLLLLAVLLGACITIPTPQPTATTAVPVVLRVEENPYRPQPEDAKLRRTGLELINTNLLERFDLDPFRVELRLSGSMPSACNQLRVAVARPNDDYQVFIEVYSIVNPNIKCENVFQQFEASILLGVYSTGRYTVWINEGLVGDFIMY